MLRVVHIAEAFEGGVLTWLRGMLPKIAALDCGVTLICSLDRRWPNAGNVLVELQDAGVEVHVISMKRDISPREDLASLAAVCRTLRRCKADAVHTHASKAGALGRIAARMAGVRAVFHTPHCFAFLRRGGPMHRQLYVGMERALGRLTYGVVSVSSAEAAIAVEMGIVPPERSICFDNALEDVPVSSPLAEESRRGLKERVFGLPASSLVVTAACRLVPYKGVKIFAGAAECARTPNVVFVLAGDGPLRPVLERLIVERHLGSRLRLLGHVSDMGALYAVSDVVVSCSHAEGMPFALLEAMREKRPIVATDVSGHRDLIENGATGLLVSEDPQSVAQAVDTLLADAGRRNTFATAGYARFRERHLVDDKARQLMQLYSVVCERR